MPFGPQSVRLRQWAVWRRRAATILVTMAQLRIRKDTDEGIVEVDTGDGWRGLAPDAARETADMYEEGIGKGDVEDTPNVRQFIKLLRQYADDLS